MFHQPESLAVAFRLRRAEIPAAALPCCMAFFDGDYRYRLAVQPRRAADYGRIVAKAPVAVHLRKISKNIRYIVKACGSFVAPGELHSFIRRQVHGIILPCSVLRSEV